MSAASFVTGETLVHIESARADTHDLIFGGDDSAADPSNRSLNRISSRTRSAHTSLFSACRSRSQLYVLLSATAFWPVIVAILTTAGAFHNFVIRRFEE
jgi:hypothetical protein